MKASPPPAELPTTGYYGIAAGALLSAVFLYVPAGDALVLAGPVITSIWILEGAVAGGFAGMLAGTFADAGGREILGAPAAGELIRTDPHRAPQR